MNKYLFCKQWLISLNLAITTSFFLLLVTLSANATTTDKPWGYSSNFGGGETAQGFDRGHETIAPGLNSAGNITDKSSFFVKSAYAVETETTHDRSSSDIRNVTHNNIQSLENSEINSGWILIAILTVIGINLALFFWMKGDVLKITTKMIGLVCTLIAMLVMLSIEGIIAMNNIGTELVQIAEENIPLNNAISKITANQLEQSIMLERAALSAGVDVRDEQKFNKAVAEFDRLANLVDEEIKDAEAMAEHALANVDDQVARAEYQRVLGQLKQIEKEHKNFNLHGNQMFTALRQGHNKEAHDMLFSIEAEEDQLNHELETLEHEIGEFTKNSALKAEYHEKASVRTMTIVSVIGIILSLFIGFIIVRSILKGLTIAVTQTESLSTGDLSKEISITSKDEIGKLQLALKTMQGKLTDVILGIKSGAEEVSVSTEQVSMGNSDLSQRTQEQATSLEEVASSMEEMTSTVNGNAENARQANQLAIAAKQQADKGGEVVNKTINSMNQITEASKKISDIIGVIDEIAFQTNLLALNAAVEAARAGDQGRGFAVVASEVRTLAERSATAAKEIKTLIEDTVDKVNEGSKLVGDSGKALEEIVISIKKVNDIISEIDTASQEQASGIEQVNQAVMQMDEMTQQNSSLVEEAAAASEAMGAQAQELKAMVEYFKLDWEEEKQLLKNAKKDNSHYAAAYLGSNGGHKSGNGSNGNGSDKNHNDSIHNPDTALPVILKEDQHDSTEWQEF